MLTAASALAGLILQQLDSLRADIHANNVETNKRLDSLDSRLRTVEQVQAQHSIKLDQQGELLQRLAERELGVDASLPAEAPEEASAMAKFANP